MMQHFQHKLGLMTHLSHQMGLHDQIENDLPVDVRIAFDGMVLNFN